MCRKFGKKHPNYRDPKEGLYKKEDNGIPRIRRAHNGRRIVDHYGFNSLVAWSYDREKFQGGEQFSLNLKMTRAKRARLDRTEELQDRVGPRAMTDRQLRDHLRRNHVTYLGRM
ncbi:hypothetical protein [Pseudomonas phage D6]|nr:hypothetical protein [Pseudomonas phage D6]